MTVFEASEAFQLCVLLLGKDLNCPESPWNELVTVMNANGEELT